MPTILKRRAIRRRATQHSMLLAPSGWTSLRAAGIAVLQARSLAKFPWLIQGFSTRLGGTSHLGNESVLNLGLTGWDKRENVTRNRAMLLEALGAEGMELVTLRQIHSDFIHIIESPSKEPLRGDAFITRVPGLLLGVQTADCVPILLVDPRNKAVAAIHAGWRGTLRRIAAKTIGRMRMLFGTRPAGVLAALGPGIGSCCYEVGPDVVKEFAGQFADARAWFKGPYEQLASGEESNPLPWLSMMPPGHQAPPPRIQLDLIAANRAILLDAGVRPANLSACAHCTFCRNDLFFSYRREGARTGRMMSVIGLRPPR